MYKVINLTGAMGEEIEVPAKTTGTTAFWYRQVFGDDIMVNLTGTNDTQLYKDGDMGIGGKLLYIMNAQAEGKDLTELNFESFLEWLDRFSSNEVLLATQEILDLYISSKKSTSTPKKGNAQLRGR